MNVQCFGTFTFRGCGRGRFLTASLLAFAPCMGLFNDRFLFQVKRVLIVTIVG